jgi:hypothetical protein
MEVYEIDLLRALFVDRLNDPSIFLASFYEQIEDDQSISRYVETIKELIALQISLDAGDSPAIYEQLKHLVTGFSPDREIVDFISSCK